MKNARGPRALEAGAVLTAVAASICCIGPLVLASLGLAGGALLLKFAPLRPYLLGATVLLLGGAFYHTYRKPAAEGCGSEASCNMPVGRRSQRAILWIVTGIVLLAASFPLWSRMVF